MGLKNGAEDHDNCPEIVEFTPTPSIGCSIGNGSEIDRMTSSVIFTSQSDEIL